MKKRTKILVPLLLCGSLIFTGCTSPAKKDSSSSKSSSTSQKKAPKAAKSDNEEFNDYMNDLFIEYASDNTLNLHYTVKNPSDYGIEDFEPTLGDLSKDAREQYKKDLEKHLDDLHDFDYSTLSADQQIDYDILEDSLTSDTKMQEYELYQEYLSPSNGYQSQLPVLLAEYDFYSIDDVDDYLALLKDMPRFYDEIMAFEREKSEAGLFMSDTLCNKVIESCQSYIDNPDQNILITTFNNKIANVPGITDDQIESYKALNTSYVKEYVIPAYENMITELNSLLGTGKNDLGIANLPDGADYYELKVQSSTGCSDDIDDMYDNIESHRKSAIKDMMKIMKDDPDVIDHFEDYEFNYENETEMIESLQEAMKDDFPEITGTDYTLSYVDESLQDSLAPAFYLTAPIDNYEHNKIYINPAGEKEKLDLYTTLAHEGYPGHLYQTVMSYKYDLTPVRSFISCSGYTEGWATYVEMQSYSYSDVDESVASMLRIDTDYTISLYAQSDIGLNYYGWTREEFEDFWATYGVTDKETLDELLTLLVSDPGNYLDYYVGYLEFEELKEDQQKALGDDFTNIDFHRTILDIGPASFDIIDKHFETVYYE